MRTKTTELHAACEQRCSQGQRVCLRHSESTIELKERIDRPMEETQEPAPPPAPPAVSNLRADVPVDVNDHDPEKKKMMERRLR